MDADKLLSSLRTDILHDSGIPQLWTTTRLIDCLNEAYLEFAEETLLIRDSTSSVTVITLDEGVAEYEYDQSILSVLTARIAGASTNLQRVGNSELDGSSVAVGTYEWLEVLNAQYPEGGTPTAFTTDEGLYLLRVYPVPTAADTGKELKLRVARLPAELIDENDLSIEIEIPRQYVMGVAHGAAARAYSDQDADGYDPANETKHRGKFLEYVARAKKGMRRQMFQPLTWRFGNDG
jgi:hypothetical protein